jgi:hypothetical protein
MTRRDLVAVYSRAGAIIAAFAFVASIIAAPLLPKFGSPTVVTSNPQNEPAFRSLVTPASLKTN